MAAATSWVHSCSDRTTPAARPCGWLEPCGSSQHDFGGLIPGGRIMGRSAAGALGMYGHIQAAATAEALNRDLHANEPDLGHCAESASALVAQLNA